MPFIIDEIYDCTPPAKFFDVELSKSDIWDYYTQLLSLTSTIVLGVIAVVQTYRSQKKADEINDLQLSIAQRELAVVEKLILSILVYTFFSRMFDLCCLL